MTLQDLLKVPHKVPSHSPSHKDIAAAQAKAALLVAQNKERASIILLQALEQMKRNESSSKETERKIWI